MTRSRTYTSPPPSVPRGANCAAELKLPAGQQDAVLAAGDDLAFLVMTAPNGPPQPLSTDSLARRHASSMKATRVIAIWSSS
jgi:hypothetical protein